MLTSTCCYCFCNIMIVRNGRKQKIAIQMPTGYISKKQGNLTELAKTF